MLFRSSIVKEFTTNDKKPELSGLEKRFDFNSGIFVTLNNKSGLRGCIGFPLPNKKLYNALVDASIAAATEDPRFPPVKNEELDEISFEVTILSPPKKISVKENKEYPSEIKVGRDGLIVDNGFSSGLLLPQVPTEYGWNEKEFLEYTCQKAGLNKDAWKEKSTTISKFQGVIFKEENPNGDILRESSNDLL